MSIEVISEFQLTAFDEAEIADVIAASFPTEYSGRSFFQQRPHLRVIWRKERILAHIALFYRSIRIDDDLTVIAGVGDVACHPDFREQGIATKLMDHSLALAAQSQAQFALLFGARTLYDRAGFLPSKNAYTSVDMTGAKTHGVGTRKANFLMVNPLKNRVWPETAQIDFLGPLF